MLYVTKARHFNFPKVFQYCADIRYNVLKLGDMRLKLANDIRTIMEEDKLKTTLFDDNVQLSLCTITSTQPSTCKRERSIKARKYEMPIIKGMHGIGDSIRIMP